MMIQVVKLCIPRLTGTTSSNNNRMHCLAPQPGEMPLKLAYRVYCHHCQAVVLHSTTSSTISSLALHLIFTTSSNTAEVRPRCHCVTVAVACG